MNDAHLSDQQLADLAWQGHGDSSRSEAIDHLSLCRACRRRLAALNDDVPEFEEGPPSPEALARVRAIVPTSHRPRYWLPAAAMFVFVVMGTLVWQHGWPEFQAVQPASQRAAPGSAALVAQLLAPDESPIPLQKTRFRWTSIPEAQSYEVQIVDLLGEIVLSRSARESFLEIDLAGIPLDQDRIYFWQVVARLPDDARTSSDFRPLRLQEAP